METKKCPECAEAILAEAKRCKHCGSDVTKASQVAKAGIGLVQAGVGLIIFAIAMWYLLQK